MSETNFDYEPDLVGADQPILYVHCKAVLLKVSPETVLGIAGKLTCPECGAVSVYRGEHAGCALTVPLSTSCDRLSHSADSEA